MEITNSKRLPLLRIAACGLLALSLSACDDDDQRDNDEPVVNTLTYQIELTNLTHGQPFSPPAAGLTAAGYNLWQIGSTSSVEVEKVAEGGDASEVLANWPSDRKYAAEAAVMPGASLSFTLQTSDTEALGRFSLIAMLVKTNDGFTGVSNLDVSQLAAGESITMYTRAYDAGTELNSEASGTLPPNGGFDAARDDFTALVTLHSGVVTQDDGLPSSILSEAQRFDQPVAKLTITRL